MNEKTRLGRWGEALAAAYLREKGFSIVTANSRSRYGEIDLIAQNGEFIVFAEVKLRAGTGFGGAREAVGDRKQERIRRTALMWLSEHENELQPRFDVIEIYAPYGADTRNPRLIHLENAF